MAFIVCWLWVSNLKILEASHNFLGSSFFQLCVIMNISSMREIFFLTLLAEAATFLPRRKQKLQVVLFFFFFLFSLAYVLNRRKIKVIGHVYKPDDILWLCFLLEIKQGYNFAPQYCGKHWFLQIRSLKNPSKNLNWGLEKLLRSRVKINIFYFFVLAFITGIILVVLWHWQVLPFMIFSKHGILSFLISSTFSFLVTKTFFPSCHIRSGLPVLLSKILLWDHWFLPLGFQNQYTEKECLSSIVSKHTVSSSWVPVINTCC